MRRGERWWGISGRVPAVQETSLQARPQIPIPAPESTSTMFLNITANLNTPLRIWFPTQQQHFKNTQTGPPNGAGALESCQRYHASPSRNGPSPRAELTCLRDAFLLSPPPMARANQEDSAALSAGGILVPPN